VAACVTNSWPWRPSIPCSRHGVLVEDWRIEYNTIRPHSALGYLTPSDYAKGWAANHSPLS
jgi:transposase InsO family protein